MALAVLLSGLAAGTARGSVSLGSTFTFTQNFDGLGAASSGLFPAYGTVKPIPGSTGFDGAKIGGDTGLMSYQLGTGSSTTGAIYNYGATAASADRALGSLASANGIGAYGVQIVNNSGATLTNFTLTFTQEQYRSANGSGAIDNTVVFAYGTDVGQDIETFPKTYLTNDTLMGNSSGNLVSTFTSAAANNPALPTPRNVIVTNLNVPAGNSIYLRWSDAYEPGSNAGLAIDDLTFTANVVPEPATVLGGALMAIALGWSQRRRFGGWLSAVWTR